MGKSLTFTVGIPVRYLGGDGLVKTVKNIRSAERGSLAKLIIVADNQPLSKNIRDGLINLGVELLENRGSGSQQKKVKQIITMSGTDILILTHDDIRLRKNTIINILKAFQENPKLSMVSTHVQPIRATSIMESILEVGQRLVCQIGVHWNEGDNYLLANGRCLAFKTKLAKKFDIPEEVINGDGYLYFENKRLGGTFCHAKNAPVYIKSPETLKEHLNQNLRFQYSQKELQRYFNFDLSKEYAIPIKIVLRYCFKEFFRSPLHFILYLGVFFYTKFQQKDKLIVKNTQWSVDVSTKKIQLR